MGMSKKAIETFSVNAVRDSIMMSKFLDQYIPDNDKEPFWDGAVYVFENESHKKENFKGRVSVQVKGTECNDLTKSEITFPVSITDLKGYLTDGGAIFFVVYIANNGLSKKIYYIELTTIRIRMILESAKKQKTKNISFKEFPTDNDQKATIFFNFLQNRQKQTSFAEAKLFSIEELQEQGVLESITIPLSGVKIDKDPQMALLSNDVYLYANIKGSSVPQPINMVPVSMHTHEEINSSITIDGKEYYSKIKVIRSAKKTKFVIGDSFTITATNDNKITNVNYVSSDKLSILVKDLDFILTYIEHGYFESNGQRFPFDFESADFSKFDCEEQKKILSYAQKTAQTLKILGCKKDLTISKLTELDYRNLARLNTAIIDQKPVSGLKEGLPPICNTKIGDLNFILSFYAQEGKKGTYLIKDFFDSELVATFQGSNNERLPISQYALLNAEDLVKADNIKYDVFLPSFQKIEKHIDTFTRANWFFLDLLSAYDLSGNKDFLKTAKDFIDWILTSNEEELSDDIKTLNNLQLIKRERQLNADEIKLLYAITEDPNSSEMVLVGAYLLLDQQVPAELHFDKLTEQEKCEFKEYPIYHFWKQTEDENDG